MDKEDIKNIGQKVYKGCGCMSIGIVVPIIILCIIGSFIDDEEPEESAKVEQSPAMRGMCSRKPFNSRPTGWLARQNSAGSN